jgi:hypothetical protein
MVSQRGGAARVVAFLRENGYTIAALEGKP